MTRFETLKESVFRM